ncbi:hypothetical protein HZ326_20632 [Fusarium oxysporum f. sp. albedinis]|nr:hypothetical protein HZ326_20632 [Fusarium oxysporum f. sp. albedinis]
MITFFSIHDDPFLEATSCLSRIVFCHSLAARTRQPLLRYPTTLARNTWNGTESHPPRCMNTESREPPSLHSELSHLDHCSCSPNIHYSRPSCQNTFMSWKWTEFRRHNMATDVTSKNASRLIENCNTLQLAFRA